MVKDVLRKKLIESGIDVKECSETIRRGKGRWNRHIRAHSGGASACGSRKEERGGKDRLCNCCGEVFFSWQ